MRARGRNSERAWTNIKLVDDKKDSESKERMYAEIIRIAEEEWKPIRDEYDKLQDELRTLVNLDILPRIDETSKGLGE